MELKYAECTNHSCERRMLSHEQSEILLFSFNCGLVDEVCPRNYSLYLLKCNLCADFSLVTIVILKRGQLLFIFIRPDLTYKIL